MLRDRVAIVWLLIGGRFTAAKENSTNHFVAHIHFFYHRWRSKNRLPFAKVYARRFWQLKQNTHYFRAWLLVDTINLPRRHIFFLLRSSSSAFSKNISGSTQIKHFLRIHFQTIYCIQARIGDGDGSLSQVSITHKRSITICGCIQFIGQK